MILFGLFFMGFTGIHQLIISILKINTFPERFGIKKTKNIPMIFKNSIIRPLQLPF